jgi:DNA-binding HxlR family transcriptional regulator
LPNSSRLSWVSVDTGLHSEMLRSTDGMSSAGTTVLAMNVIGKNWHPVIVLIGKKRHPVIVYQLLQYDALRFNELSDEVGTISSEMLLQSFGDLEQKVLVDREIANEKPSPSSIP